MNEYNLYNSALQGDLDSVKTAIQNGAKYLDWGLEGACLNGNESIFNFLIDSGAQERTLLYAAEGGHPLLIEKLIAMGACDWDSGMRGASRRGDMKMINFFIEKGANNWGQGYIGACLGPRDEDKSFVDTAFFFSNKGFTETEGTKFATKILSFRNV